MNYQPIKNFVKEKIRNNGRKNSYPFRDRYDHTLRVIKWAERIQKKEGGDLEVVKLACLFHDIGWDENIDHNIVSREIAEKYLFKIDYNKFKRKKVLEAVENHCLRKNHSQELNIESYIVMDADILDEVGAISILWDAMATTYEEDPGYKKAYKRTKKYTEDLKKKKKLLQTETGKKYYNEKINFIDDFIKELEFELFKINKS